MQYLKFRFWCPSGKAFVRNHQFSGKVDDLFCHSCDILIPQQCLGIRDLKRRWIHEGDILELKQAAFKNAIHLWPKDSPNTLHVEVCRDPSIPSNFFLEHTNPKSHLTAYLPLEFAKKSKIAGNIFQNP